MLRILLAVAVLGLCRGDVVPIRYPKNSPCILVDIDASFQLVWTNADGKTQAIPDFTLEDATADAGFCAKSTPVPNVVLAWIDGGTFVLSFTNQSGKAEIGWTMKYSPDVVFKNSNTELVTHSGNLGSGPLNMAYSCHHVPVVNDTQTKTGMNKYTLTITIKSVKAQAFGVANGNYSEENPCQADITSTLTTPSTKPSSSTTPTKTSLKPSTKLSSTSTKPTNSTTSSASSPSKPSPTTKPSTATTKPSTATTKPSTATTKPSIATTKSSTATTKPSTATTKPSTATTKPSTATTKPSTATTKPSTASTKPSTATTKPTVPTTPAPAPNRRVKETFEAYDKDDKQCVLMEGEFIFSLVYPKTDNTNGSVDIAVQEINKIEGNCNASNGAKNIISVTFYDDWQMDLTISKKTTSALLTAEADGDISYYWSNINLKYKYTTKLGGKPLFQDVKANATAPALNVNLTSGTFEASTGGSYLCNSNQEIDLGGGNKLQTWNLQYDAFTSANHTTFSDKNLKECSADSKTSSIVPIAVGAALAGLVVIVLIAYLIGRRRNRKGYESV